MIRKINIFKFNNLIKLRNLSNNIPQKIISDLNLDADVVSCLSKNLRVSETHVLGIFLKNPTICKVKLDHVKELFSVFKQHNLNVNELLRKPLLLNLTPNGIERRAEILLECGFKKVTLSDISKFLTLVTNKTISELKSSEYIPQDINIQDRLTAYLSMWPCSPSMSTYVDDSNTTLLELRMRILERYLELILNLQSEEFQKALKSYPRMRSRPFSQINLTLKYLQNLLKMPEKTIRKNLFVINTHPNKIMKLLTHVESLSGIDIEDIVNKRPAILISKVENLLGIQSLMKDYNIPLDFQQRYMEIYTLSLSTVQKRFFEVFYTPEYKVLLNNPRILRLIVRKTKADERLNHLKSSNKTGFSLNTLSGNEDYFQSFDNNPHRTRSNDFVQNICHGLGNKYSFQDVYTKLKRHRFHNKTSIITVKETLDNLSKKFSDEEIYLNCQILLHPWDRIKVYLYPLLHYNKSKNVSPNLSIFRKNNRDLVLRDKLTNTQILNLVLYYMEKEHNFDGSGIWQPFAINVDKNILAQCNL